MSLRINHNLAALNAHRNLINTTSDLNDSMQKLSSGYRINKGSDDPAGLVISEQFRAQIAGLERAISNSEGSVSMIQTAEGALTEINSLLTSMRELAIHAANEGFNDADQLAADQAEIRNAIATINRIAANTQFGTKNLLDGSKENVATITSPNISDVTLTNSNLRDGTYSLSAVKTADATAELNTTSYGISLANTDGDPYNLDEGVHNLDVVQSSDVASKTGSAMSITDAWGNGLQVIDGAATKATVSATGQFTAGAGNTGTYTFILNVQENGSTPIGNQSFTISIGASDTASTVKTKLESAIGANSELSNIEVGTSYDASSGGTKFSFSYADEGAQYSLRAEASSTDATASTLNFAQQSNRGASDAHLTFTTVTANGTQTSQQIDVTNGTYTTMSDLADEINTQLLAIFGTVANGSGENDISVAVSNNNRLQFSTLDEGSDYSIKFEAEAGNNSEDLGNVLGLTADTQANAGTDAIIDFNGYANTITSVEYGQTGTATLWTADYGEADQGTLDVILASAANGIDTGNMLLTTTATKFAVQLDGGTAVEATAGVDAVVYSADRSEWITVNYGLTSEGGNETISNTDQSLVFQIGGNVGQTANISLRNMAATALGMNIAGNMFSSLSEIDVTTAEGAQDAQAIIDQAINEVSTTRGTLGSFQKNTLESNLRNLRIAAQNLTSSESSIRDTDMASEMSEFTKNQILMQAGTAMLAQANQVPQVVLSLFG
ncbi:MAG TPA: flagellin [candidate division Zixibacteria bacterium]|nr:flagellin [candidate division Zixibacteria bacterium]